MHAHADAITRFYTSFAKRDAEGMVAEYAKDVRFSDPVFRDLRGDEARAMWRMLIGRAKDIALEFRDVEADDHGGRAHWEARYTFTTTGRFVHNVIDARFTFRDGKIATHEDTFDLWRWSGMALGTTGKLLGWTPFVQAGIRRKGRAGLEAYMKGA